MNNERIGIMLREYREAVGLSQSALAAKVRVDKSLVSKWERGVTPPDVDMIPVLAAVLHVDENTLLDYAIDRTRYKELILEPDALPERPDFYRIVDGEYVGRKYKQGTVFRYSVAIPKSGDDFALHICHDGLNTAEVKAYARLAEEGKAPPTVVLGVSPGTLYVNNGTGRNMRYDDYDQFNSEYADLLVYELIPSVLAEHSVKVSESPDMHAISGGSSGGVSSFTVAWFSGYFHRISINSPSFLAMGRGDEALNFIRKCETKPFRIHEEAYQLEGNDSFGSSYLASLEAKNAFEFAGYDFKFVYYPFEGHMGRYRNSGTAYERLGWLWQDYKTKPVTAPRNSKRVSAVIPTGSRWEVCGRMPTKTKPVFELPSSDYAVEYVGSVDCDEIIMHPLTAEKTPTTARYVHAMLHTLSGIYPKGAIDMELDENDRLYVLTAVGIQTARSFGMIDAILDLPDGAVPELIELASADGRNYIYVKTAQATYRREIIAKHRTAEPTEPKCTGYFD